MSIREARLRAGLSVRDVMEKLGVSDAAVYQWETGATVPRVPMLLRLAELFHCSTDELLGRDTGQNSV